MRNAYSYSYACSHMHQNKKKGHRLESLKQRNFLFFRVNPARLRTFAVHVRAGHI